ncbi:MAG TPA: PQQ-binding-like beta-propeller repeat protein [Actinomycetales bacterium]|nr:PQQ-binding-like beta-propeller repeat protein [Actinomycetales bacterium]
MTAPAFRHDPVKSLLRAGETGKFHWDREPIVCGYQMLTFDDPRGGPPLEVPVSATPAVIPGVGVVVASDDGFVRLFKQGLTKFFWQRKLNSAVYASLVVDAKRDRVVISGTNGRITCLDLRGNVVWSTDIGAPVFATPTVIPEADLLVIAAFHSRCVGLDLDTGVERFSVTLPEPWHATHGGSASHRDPYASPAVTADGNIIICCAEHVLCLSPDGTQVWQREVGTGIKASPVALHRTGEVAVCPVDGRCLFLDASTGEVRTQVFLGGKVVGSPAVSGTILAAGVQSGRTWGMDIGTHEIAWMVDQGAPRSYTSYSVLPTGDFIATAERGNIICLRRDDGRFLWETSQVMGVPHHDPTMDITPMAGTDGRMYCASYTGVVYEFRFQPMHEEEVP